MAISEKPTVLCVDDEKDNVESLERLLRKEFKVLKATSGTSALDLLKQNPDVSIIISDQRMPQMTGTEFLALSQQSHPAAIRILLTGFTDIESVIEAINKGQIYRYITKPWDSQDLLLNIRLASEKFQLQQELQIKNQKLERALEELKSLDEAKNHFMILINHELKTPLTAIASYSELLKETKLTDEQLLFVKRIVEAAERLNTLVHDTLIIMSSQTGQLKTHKEWLNLGNFFKTHNPFIQKNAKEILKKNLSVKINVPDTMAIYCDAKQLITLIEKLTANAVRFASDNSEITLSAETKSANLPSSSAHKNPQEDNKTQGDWVVINIENQGPKIPESLIEEILKPFVISEQAMHHTKGTGLGLSVVKAIAQNQGLEFHIQNTDQGVLNQIKLPAFEN